VVMEVVAAVAVEDMVEAVVEEDMEVEAMAVAAVVVDMEAAAVDMVAAVEVVDMEVVDMVEMVATEEAVEVVVATVVVAVAMAAAAMEVDVVAEDMVEVATRPPLQQDYLQKKHFRFKISIHAYLVLFCYAVLSNPKLYFFCICYLTTSVEQPKVAIQNSVKNPDETL